MMNLTTGVFHVTPQFLAIKSHIAVLEAETQTVLVLCCSKSNVENLFLARRISALPMFEAATEHLLKHFAVSETLDMASEAGKNILARFTAAQHQAERGGV
jgi:hypothetical protein